MGVQGHKNSPPPLPHDLDPNSAFTLPPGRASVPAPLLKGKNPTLPHPLQHICIKEKEEKISFPLNIIFPPSEILHKKTIFKLQSSQKRYLSLGPMCLPPSTQSPTWRGFESPAAEERERRPRERSERRQQKAPRQTLRPVQRGVCK